MLSRKPVWISKLGASIVLKQSLWEIDFFFFFCLPYFISVQIPKAIVPRWPNLEVVPDKTAPATRDAVYAFPVFRDVLSTPHGSWDYTSQKDFLALKLLEEIQQEIKVSTKAVRDYVPRSWIWGHFVLGQTFREIRSEGATETAERVSLQRAGVSKWWRELWETFISQIHFIDPGPVRAELTVVGGLEENEWLLAHMLTPTEPAALTLPPRLWNSLWWLFYQRSCPSPGKPRTGEDDPHFLKAKCSVLISRNELLVTRVNLLRPGRFIVSCRSWTHRTDLYRSVLSHAACLTWTHMHGKVYMQRTHLHCSLEQHRKQTGRHVDPWISNHGKMEERIERRRLEKYYPQKREEEKNVKASSPSSSLIIHRLCNLPSHPSRNWREFNIRTTLG